MEIKQIVDMVLHEQNYGARAAALRKLLDSIKGEVSKQSFNEDRGAKVVPLGEVEFVIDEVIELI